MIQTEIMLYEGMSCQIVYEVGGKCHLSTAIRCRIERFRKSVGW